MTEVRVGLTLPSFQSDPTRVLEVAVAAEQAGLDGVFAFDHLFRQRGDAEDAEKRPALELLTMTAAVAAATSRIAVGTLVARATLRLPGMSRAVFDTLARIAPGRIIAGLGAGDDDSLPEDIAFGVLPDRPESDLWVAPARQTPDGAWEESDLWVAPARQTPDGAWEESDLWVAPARQTPDGAWEEAGPPVAPFPVEWRLGIGRYRVARLEATVEALRGRGYPVWVAGTSPAAIRLATGLADGWNVWGGTPSRFAPATTRVRNHLAEAGRDPTGFTFTWGGLAVLGATPGEAAAKWDRLGGGRSGIVRGTAPEVADQIAAYAAAGADWVILGPIDSSDPTNAAVLGEARRLLRAAT